MSEFTFSCPVCGQPILSDTASAGASTVCPSCQRNVAIPQAYAPAAQGTPGTSGLAVASFVCSIFLCVGCIPGIICGHLARRKIHREPGLGGNGFAIAGLVISYLSLVATIAFSVLVIACMSSPTFMKGFRDGFQQARLRHDARVSFATAQDTSETTNAPATPDPLWMLNLTIAEFPDHPAAGKIHGQEFTVESATVQGGTITLRQGAGNYGDRSIIITTFATNDESLAGKNYDISPANSDFSQGVPPHVRLAWKEEGARNVKVKPYTTGFALKLQLGNADADGKIPGKIYLCFPDNEKSYVAGSFDLEIKKAVVRKKKPKKPADN